jgi:hypothetical protein
MIPQISSTCQAQDSFPNEDLAIARFIRFLKHIDLKGLLSKISDSRQVAKIKYANSTLILWALSVFFFRQGSKNSLQTTIESMPRHKQEAILRYLEIDEDSIPYRSVVDDYLNRIEPEEINNLLLEIFLWCKKSKLFYNHAESLLPNNNYHLGVDGFWVHKYNAPHAVDEDGVNSCPYCLPRTYNKGKPEEYTEWVHAFVTFVLIFPTNLQLPIYIHPLQAAQVNASKNDKELKQECELTAFYSVLPELRQKLGRIPITLLLDSLYAHEPAIHKAEEVSMGYLIVRQEESLKSVGLKCDELEGTELYQKSYRAKNIVKQKSGHQVEQMAKWFNQVTVGKEAFTNVLRFEEIIKDESGNIIDTYKNEWLMKEKIHKGNCFDLAKRGRMRFSCHEDMHNTLKNRGFDAKHDYARAKPNCMVIWKLLMFVALSIDQLFSFTNLGIEAKGTRSWMKFARDLLQQLVETSWSVINASPILQNEKIQFRFTFGIPSG